jgi:hypothetical protein
MPDLTRLAASSGEIVSAGIGGTFLGGIAVSKESIPRSVGFQAYFFR